MKKTDLINELNDALVNDRDGKRKTDYIQTTLTWEQWKEVAPYMSFHDYKFERLFDEDMTDEDWENDDKIDGLAWWMVECAKFITAVLIDPFDNSCANVIFANGIIERGDDFVESYYVVNV